MTRQTVAGQARVGRTVGAALAAAGATLALAAGAAAAQDTTRAGSGSGRRAVDALTARSAAFRDTVARGLGTSDFEYGSPLSRAWADRLAGGFTLSVSQPTGEFKRFAGVGIGIAANAQVSADRMGVLGLRVEGGAQNYGRASGPVQSYGLLLNRQYRQVTSNDIYWGSIGPQVSLPLGPVRPYAFGTVGVANFSTTSRFVGLGLDGRQSQTLGDVTDLRNYATTRGYGGGLRFRIPRGPERTALSVDLGARAHLIRSAQYLVPGALSSPAADPTVAARRGQANFVTYHLGVSAGGR